MTAWRARLAVLRAQSEASSEIYAGAKSAISANRCTTSSPAKAIGAFGTNGTGKDLAKRVEFLLRAAEDAAWALAGPEIGPVLEIGAADHDAAERAALVAFYVEPATMPATGPALVYCFPCGQPVLPRDRKWSEGGRRCCAACATKRAANRGIP